GQLLPGGGLLLGGPHEVLDVVEVDLRQVGTPVRQRLLGEQPERLQTQVPHPLGLVLLGRDVADDLLVEAAARRGAGHVGVGPAVLVGAEPFELGVRGRRHYADPPGRDVLSWRCGSVSRWVRASAVREPMSRGLTCVVQTPSPCAMVARRRTGVPSSRAKASTSASHSSGNSAAAWATGQWCWHNCSPPAGAAPAEAA